jgi:hypothetical protein
MGEIIKKQIIDESMVGTAMWTDAYVRYLQAKLKTVTLERDALGRRWQSESHGNDSYFV